MKRIIAAALVISLCLTLQTGCDGNKENETNDAAVKTAVLNEFNKISQIPRESGHERAMSSHLKSWAKENGFKVVRDSSNNVIMAVAAVGMVSLDTPPLKEPSSKRIPLPWAFANTSPMILIALAPPFPISLSAFPPLSPLMEST
jgi:hypothetical protein